MAVTLGQAIVEIVTNNEQLKKGLDNAQQQARGFASSTASIISTGLAAGAVVAGAAVAAGLKAGFDIATDIQAAENEIQDFLGTTKSEAIALGKVAQDVFKNNFFDSVQEAGQAVALVRQQLGDLADDELQRITQRSQTIAESFDEDFNRIVDSAKTLVETGLVGSFDEAFDLITTGFQQGLDRSGDFLDSIGEYSTQFANAGATGEEFFNLLESGLAGGVLGTDKAADAFKEFSLRIADDSDSTIGALKSIGINYEDLRKGFVDGSITTADAFDLVLQALNDTDNDVTQFNAGVALLGTQFEDLGRDAALGLSLVGDSFANAEGSADALGARYNNLGDVVEGFKRRALLAIAPIGNSILSLANATIPLVESAFSRVEEVANNVFGSLADSVSGFITLITGGFPVIDAFFAALDGFIFNVFGEEAADKVLVLTKSIQGFIGQLSAFLAPIISAISQFVSWKDILIIVGAVLTQIVIAALASFVAATVPVIATITVVIGIVATLRNAWESNFLGIRDITQQVIDFIVPLVQNAVQSIQQFWAENGTNIVNTVTLTWQTITQTVQNALNFLLNDVIVPIVSLITGFWNENSATILQITTDVWNAILAYYTFIFEQAQLILAAFTLAFEGDWRGFGETLRLVWDNIWDAVISVLSSLQATISPILSGLINSILTAFRGVDWQGVGTSIVNGIAAGIRAGAGAVAQAAIDAANAAVEAAKGFLGIESPSKVFAEIGGDTVAGFALGIRDSMAEATGAMAGILDAGVNAIGGAGSINPSIDIAGALAPALAGIQPNQDNRQFVLNQNGVSDGDRAVRQLRLWETINR